MENVKQVLVSLITEVPIQIQLKWRHRKDKVLVVE
jgi:hypothetical protein